MTTLPADKLRAMCEAILALGGFQTRWDEACDIARALLELLPAEGEGVDSDGTEALANWMIANSYATGHGDTVADLIRELDWQHKGRQPGGEGPGWRPIENAPKDGTEVLISNAVEGAVVWIGRYVPVEDREPDMPQHDGWWNCSRWKDGDRRGMIPTHYQPLPAPPSAASRAPAVREDG